MIKSEVLWYVGQSGSPRTGGVRVLKLWVGRCMTPGMYQRLV